MAKKNDAVVQAIQRRRETRRFEERLQERVRWTNRRAARYPSPASAPPRTRRRTIGKRQAPPLDILVPERLDLDTAHEATCSFVHGIRDAVKRGHHVRLIFENVRVIRMGALILLLAQIHKLRIEFGQSALTGTYPKDKKVERQLTESGFFELLKVESRNVAPSRVNRYIRFKSDQKINGIDIQQLRQELLGQDLKMPPAIARAVFRALSEAMTNVNHHAYKSKAFLSPSAAFELRGRWWLFATLNVPHNLFSLTFYDSGVGIPKTLPRKYAVELIRQMFSLLPGMLPDDAQMIEAAMRLGRTRTDLDYRGKGLLDLAKLIDVLGAGEMNIYSRQGKYSYTPLKQTRTNTPHFIEGTLIEWRLPIDKTLSELPKDLYEQDEKNDDPPGHRVLEGPGRPISD